MGGSRQRGKYLFLLLFMPSFPAVIPSTQPSSFGGGQTGNSLG